MVRLGIVKDSEELGGLSTELIGETVAYQYLGEYTTPSKFPNDDGSPKMDTVMRVRAFRARDGSIEDMGVRLIFWGGVQRKIKEQLLTADLAVGVLTQVEQKADSSKTVYTLQTPDPDAVAVLDAAFNSGGGPF